VREVLLTSEEAEEGTAFFTDVVADGPAQHRVARFQCIQQASDRYRRRNIDCDLAADVSKISEMIGKNNADHSALTISQGAR